MDDDLDYSRLKKSLQFFVEEYVPPDRIRRDSHLVLQLEQDELRSMTEHVELFGSPSLILLKRPKAFLLNTCWPPIQNQSSEVLTHSLYCGRGFRGGADKA